MANPLSNLDSNFESTRAEPLSGFWFISGIDGTTAGQVFHPPINPADYKIPDREQGRIEIIDRGPVFQHPANQDGNTYSFTWPYASNAFYTGLEPFNTPNAYGEKPRCYIYDKGFNVVSGIACEVTNIHKEYLPGHVDPTGNLRFSLTVDFITRQ